MKRARNLWVCNFFSVYEKIEYWSCKKFSCGLILSTYPLYLWKWDYNIVYDFSFSDLKLCSRIFLTILFLTSFCLYVVGRLGYTFLFMNLFNLTFFHDFNDHHHHYFQPRITLFAYKPPLFSAIPLGSMRRHPFFRHVLTTSLTHQYAFTFYLNSFN